MARTTGRKKRTQTTGRNRDEFLVVGDPHAELVSVHKPWFSPRQRPERGEGMVMYEPSWMSEWSSGRHGGQIIA